MNVHTFFGQLAKFSILFVLILSPMLNAGEPDKINARLVQLEQTVRSMNSSEVQRSTNLANALATIEQLKGDFLKLQGDIEANQHRIEAATSTMNRHQMDMEARLRMMEEHFDIYSIQLNKALIKVSPTIGNETEVYEKALTQVKNQEYLSAIASFQEFVKKFSKSSLAENAHFWIAECHYALKDYQRAIQEYQVVVDKYPKSGKLPAVLLRQAHAFLALNMPNEAKLFFQKIITTFPQQIEAVEAKQQLELLNQPPPPPPDQPSTIPLAPGVGQQSPPPKLPVPTTPATTSERY